MSSCKDHLVLSLQHEKQAIFDANIPKAEQHRLWSQRRAEIEAVLASDHAIHSERDAHNTSLARTTSNVGLLGLAETEPGLVLFPFAS
jgi:dihydroorotase-like cyclic amidohydrolase